MKACKVCGREEVHCKGMCQKHYKQYKKYGYCLDSNPRTRNDKNEIVLHQNYAEIILYNKYNEEIDRALIDLDDVDRIKDYKWSKTVQGYATSSDKVLLHRFIMNCPKDKVIDHINHKTLDNRKSNLRICEKYQNEWNRGLYSHNKSGTTGVYFNKNKKKWHARIECNKKTVHLGYFEDIDEAIKARKEAEVKYFKEYRKIE